MIRRYIEAGYSYAAASFLTDAVDALCDARRIIIYTYPFAFYLVPRLSQTEIFINNQQNLEMGIEELSKHFEEDMGGKTPAELEADKMKVQDHFYLRI